MLYGFKLEDSSKIDDLPSLMKARDSTFLEKQQEHIEELKKHVMDWGLFMIEILL